MNNIQNTIPFWDCSCEKRYIHMPSHRYCPECGDHLELDVSPDARIDEVTRWTVNLQPGDLVIVFFADNQRLNYTRGYVVTEVEGGSHGWIKVEMGRTKTGVQIAPAISWPDIRGVVYEGKEVELTD